MNSSAANTEKKRRKFWIFLTIPPRRIFQYACCFSRRRQKKKVKVNGIAGWAVTAEPVERSCNMNLWCWISDSVAHEEKTTSQSEGQVTSCDQHVLHVRSDLAHSVFPMTTWPIFHFRSMKFSWFTLMSSTRLSIITWNDFWMRVHSTLSGAQKVRKSWKVSGGVDL